MLSELSNVSVYFLILTYTHGHTYAFKWEKALTSLSSLTELKTKAKRC